MTRLTAYRFGCLAAVAMTLLILAGISNLFHEGSETDIDISIFDFFYAWVLLTKMILVGLTVAFTAPHSFITGPRLPALQESASEDETASGLRAFSVILSTLNLLLAIAIVYIAALVANHEFSLEPA